MTRVLYAQDRRTQRTRPFLTLHDDGALTAHDPETADAIPRLRATRGWSGERIFDECAAQSNAYVRYFEEPE
ncbi:hypothetical protein [Nocardiopsis dassonvillei]|uniref:hypothetical protein n=1 Tax=Nocardiopsis dassonvillei TaxID=2014 RepID=UPI000B9D71E9|nr:hypothetical protein [Nocardiopsis dassonvillei]ASU57823.1 hypothetical protein CGQ36_09815 [Nocardiopsis dassonvillei]MCK9874035.1 hypothetical protein [Nocardiopsis dassonvillei]